MPIALKVPATWLHQKGHRLDATYYGGAGQKEARAFIASDLERKKLRELTKGGENGIFIPSRFKRMYVDNPEYGYPYLTGSGIVQADPLSNCRYLSKKYTHNANVLALQPQMIVVTCSGLIGNTVYISDYFKGAVGSPDLLRIVANQDKILPGYLYAFLSSKIGKALVTQNTYGSVIQHIEAHHVYDLPIPLLAPDAMTEIHTLIEEAARLRTEANSSLNCLRSKVTKAIENNYQIGKTSLPRTKRISSRNLSNFEMRLDAPFYSGIGRDLYDQIVRDKHNKLSSIATVFHPVLFGKKQLKGSPERGNPLYKSSSMMKIEPETDFILSLKQIDKYEKLRVQEGWVLVTRIGTVGNVIRISKHWSGIFTDDHMIRIIPKDGYSGIIYIFLTCEPGNSLITFQKYGSVQDVMKSFLLERIPIPEVFLEQDLVERIEREVKEASAKVDNALLCEKQAISKIGEELS